MAICTPQCPGRECVGRCSVPSGSSPSPLFLTPPTHSVSFVEAKCHYVAHAGHKLMVLLPQPPWCWGLQEHARTQNISISFVSFFKCLFVSVLFLFPSPFPSLLPFPWQLSAQFDWQLLTDR